MFHLRNRGLLSSAGRRLKGGGSQDWLPHSLLLLLCVAAQAQTVPITGLAGIRFRVKDIGNVRSFYGTVLGLTETEQGFRVNDHQYLTFLVDPAAGPQRFVT